MLPLKSKPGSALLRCPRCISKLTCPLPLLVTALLLISLPSTSHPYKWVSLGPCLRVRFILGGCQHSPCGFHFIWKVSTIVVEPTLLRCKHD